MIAAESILSRYELAISELSPETTDEGLILGLLRDARKYLATLDNQHSSGLFDPQIAQRRLNFRYAAITLLNRAPWLNSSLKNELRSFIDDLPEFLPGKYRFTVDFFSGYDALGKQILGHLAGRPNLRFVEVGSLEGYSACWLLENILTHASSELTCIDTFEYSSGDRVWFDQCIDSQSMNVSDRFDYNILHTGAAEKVKKCVGRSQTVLRTLPCMESDFVYVDGSHHPKDVIQDAVLSWGLLRLGGIIAFDDYGWTSPGGFTPKTAIDAFLQLFEGDYRMIEKGHQVFLLRTY
jgi:predicted O-methyltransferase YrrM